MNSAAIPGYSYSCLACSWRGPEPDWSDLSDVDPKTMQVVRPHIARCPNCGQTRIRCVRVA